MRNIVIFAFLFTILFSFETVKAQDYTANKVFGVEDLAPREVRRNAISGSLGWNGITGVGVVYHNYLNKQMGIEAGIGLSSTGTKFGGRFSYYFMDKKFSPFVALGFNYGTGLRSALEYNTNGNSYTYTINASPFTQITGGIEYISNGGFLFKANLGYAILLKESNYEILSGSPTADERLAMDIAFGSGIVMEVSFGYAFGNGKK